MKKPVFWNSITIYLLLYNNTLLVVGLLIALKQLIDGTSSFPSSIWYQLFVFLIYIIEIAGLFIGGKKGYVLSILFIPFTFIHFFYPPLVTQLLPVAVRAAFRVIDLFSMIYLVASPASRKYINNN